MPDSSRRCGDFTAPAARITSRVASRLPASAVLEVGDTDRALAVQQDAGGVGLGLDAQVRTAAGRIEKGARGRPAPAILLRYLEIAETFLLAVVVVRIARQAFGRGGIDERIQQFGAFDHVATFNGPPRPRVSSPPGSKCSDLRKYGNTDSYDQPRLPNCAQVL